MIHLFDFRLNENKRILHRLYYHDGFLYANIKNGSNTTIMRTQIENIFNKKYIWYVVEGFTIPRTNHSTITYFDNRLNIKKRLKSYVYNRLILIHDL